MGVFNVFFFTTLSAQNVIKSLDECIRSAIDNNLTLQSGRIAIEKAKDLQGTALNIGKTNFSISQDPVSGGSPDNSMSVSQSFEFPTVYATRLSMLKAETDLERSRFEVTENELIKEVSSLYYLLLHARENLRILQEQDSLYNRFLHIAAAKYQSGETNRLEMINAERLSDENKVELHKAGINVRNIQLLFQKWLNTDETIEPRENGLPVVDFVLPVGGLDISQTPLHRVYENQLKVNVKDLSLQKQQFLPEFGFSLRNQLLLRGFNPYNMERKRFEQGNFMGFEAGVSIPLFFGEQRAKVKAAKREIQLVQVRRENEILYLQKEYQTCLNEYYKAKASLDYYTEKGNRQADEIKRLSELSYEKGEIGYIEYIRNLETAVEIRIRYAVAVNTYNQTVILLNFLQGNKSSEI
jgi:cobalt-zinc-cadmium resistance protein CzcA